MIQEGKDYRALYKVLLLVELFIELSSKCEKIVPLTKVHSRYSEIVSVMWGDRGRAHGARNSWIAW